MLHRLPNHLSELRKARKSEGGFTLIELLIVIVILGVLAGIVVFSVRGITDRGDTCGVKAIITSAQRRIRSLRTRKKAPTPLWMSTLSPSSTTTRSRPA